MKWYDLLHNRQRKINEADLHRMTASWDVAISLIKEMVSNSQTFSETDFIQQILALSYQAWSSDVHFQSEETWVVMRLRRDGVLETITVFTHASWKKYLMKIKFLSWVKMNKDTNSQDGRFDIDVIQPDETLKIDIRTSVLPWLRWESVVLRFLDSRKWLMTFPDIWFSGYHEKALIQQLKKHSWLILVTWPTGSWKTTTVYSMINYLNSPDKKIITLEDPVEYELPGIEQSQIHTESWYTFEEWLKWVLRHDPDIIMVWEIRTLASAEMAINAALTWHLVISTLHTNSAIESIARLVNMWVKPYMLATALNIIVGQRLVRRLATTEEYTPSSWDSEYIKKSLTTIKKNNSWIKNTYTWTLLRPKWWERARSKWYTWRVAVVEVLEVDEQITQAIMKWKNSYEIQDLAFAQWYISIEQNALLKVLEWVTSLAEVRRKIAE
jgi:type II secretory ATPase GspE/PulE/Tfp pilus assembly ATPase PilB-like protein